MSRVSGRAKRAIAIITGVLTLLAIVFFVTEGNRGSSATPNAQHAAQTVQLANGKIQNGMWTDGRAAQWLKSDQLVRRDGQAFVFAKSRIQLDSPLPITLAYYDLDVRDKSAYDPGATNSTRRPAKTPLFYYDGSQELKIPFPPADASPTCKYRVVLFVGFNPRGSETPEPGDLDLLPQRVQRVLGAANNTSDPELKERCKTSSVRPS